MKLPVPGSNGSSENCEPDPGAVGELVGMQAYAQSRRPAGFEHGARLVRIKGADLAERIQRSTAAIFPIYLDTEGPDPASKRIYATARTTLKYIADHSAGNMYTARKLDYLSGIYDQVLERVGALGTLAPDAGPRGNGPAAYQRLAGAATGAEVGRGAGTDPAVRPDAQPGQL